MLVVSSTNATRSREVLHFLLLYSSSDLLQLYRPLMGPTDRPTSSPAWALRRITLAVRVMHVSVFVVRPPIVVVPPPEMNDRITNRVSLLPWSPLSHSLLHILRRSEEAYWLLPGALNHHSPIWWWWWGLENGDDWSHVHEERPLIDM